MGLKGPMWACKRATVATQLWPFQRSSVALSQVRKAGKRKSVGIFNVLKSVFLSGWKISADVFLLILFVIIPHLAGILSTVFC